MQELAKGKRRKVAQGLHDTHDLVVLGGRGFDQHVAPEAELVQQPLALLQVAARG